MAPAIFSKGLRPGLYAITDGELLPGETLLAAVEAAIRGGAVLVQYREKQLLPAAKLRQALALSDLCRSAGVPLIINDDARLALQSGAAGVHLGQEDGAVAEAKALLGDGAIIGVTCHGRIDLARKARQDGADYLAFGRFYSSDTKPGAPSAALEVLAEAQPLGLPKTAIGGVTRDNGEALIRAGADLLAVVGGLFTGSPDDIEQRARDFTRLFANHHPVFNL